MAAEIDTYLREHREELVNLVEEKGTAENIMGPTFENLVNLLMTTFRAQAAIK